MSNRGVDATYLAGGLEDARRDVGAHALACNNHIRVIRSIESLVSTGKRELSHINAQITIFWSD